MHTHTRTLLAQLGFADSDKQDPRHDLACRYLAQKDVLRKVLREAHKDARHVREVRVEQVIPEAHIVKGEGQYRSTIGFADLLVRYSCRRRDRPGALRYIRWLGEKASGYRREATELESRLSGSSYLGPPDDL